MSSGRIGWSVSKGDRIPLNSQDFGVKLKLLNRILSQKPRISSQNRVVKVIKQVKGDHVWVRVRAISWEELGKGGQVGMGVVGVGRYGR